MRLRGPLALVCIVCVLSAPLAVYSDALLDPDGDVWKGYSQFEFRQVDLDDPSGSLDWATVLGGSAGFILNDHWLLGASGYISIDELEDTGSLPIVDEGDIWYLGGRMEYRFFPDEVLNLSLHLLVGGGEVTALDAGGLEAEKSSFVMVEPGITGWLKVYEFLDVGLGVGYGVASGLELDRIDDDDLSALHFTATVRLHEF